MQDMDPPRLWPPTPFPQTYDDRLAEGRKAAISRGDQREASPGRVRVAYAGSSIGKDRNGRTSPGSCEGARLYGVG